MSLRRRGEGGHSRQGNSICKGTEVQNDNGTFGASWKVHHVYGFGEKRQ